ncbi:unnamed protein product [Adineta steineri]|uniref:Uncharacterized protein n=1 Tax=Adineta steineri TaxID=433720 RepID=A0A820LYQ4_9BILA|nr:unnamed protein product [Adineta steineri]CAF4364448.1 unnamed protein product [Adineta steineri]
MGNTCKSTKTDSIIASIVESPMGLLNTAYSNDKEGRFFDLYQRLQRDNILPTVNVPYDYDCLSVQTELHKRTCPVCSVYHSSAAAMKRHK